MQINIHRIRGANAMTYGEFDFIVDEHTVYQLIGKNGSGKSSLPVILEEILFNSNSRGVAKSEIPHMFSGIKGWWGEVHFSIENDSYIVHKEVKSSAKLTLRKNGEDISGHTATQTYSVIKSILGELDFKTFSKLVYQSMDSSLDFLSATDSNRKKFLVGLLGLEEYGEIEGQLKDSLKDAKATLVTVEKEFNNIQSWIKEYSTVPDIIDPLELPEEDDATTNALEDAVGRLASINSENKLVDAHNKEVTRLQAQEEKLHKLREGVQELLSAKPTKVSFNEEELSILSTSLTSVDIELRRHRANCDKFKEEVKNTSCPTCGTALDVSKQQEALNIATREVEALKPQRKELEEKVTKLKEDKALHKKYVEWASQLEKSQDSLASLEEAYSLEGTKIPELKCKTYTNSVEQEVKELKLAIQNRKKEIQRVLEHNTKAVASNAKREEQVATLEKYKDRVQNLQEKLDQISDEVALIQVLTESFGPKGIISYKIESSIKVFEDLINEYLSSFLAGEFALSFELEGSKLKVIIYSSGIKMGMKSLSSGEKNAVTIATLLAIRTLMSSISKVNLNLLFLDEVISVLDSDRRDTLIDILLKETHLNTFLVSHGYNHPLTKDIHLEKVNNISRVVNG